MINKKIKGFFLTTAMACLIATPVMSADNNDPDHKRRADEARAQREALKTENVHSYNGSIPTGSNPFQYLPTDIHENIYAKASEKNSQTAKDLTSIDKYSNDLMYMNIAKSIRVETSGGGYTRIYLDNDKGSIVNNRVLQILCEMHPDLKNLTIHNNEKITDLTPILMLHNLELLDIKPRGITVIPNLADLDKLTLVSLPFAGIQDLSFLNGLHLETLNLQGCTHITNLEPLLHVNIGHELNLEGCTGITDLTPLEKQINLKNIALCDTNISQEKILTLSRALPHCAILYGSTTGDAFSIQNGQRL